MKIQIVNVSVAQTAKVLTLLYMLMSLPFLAIGALLGAFSGGNGMGVAIVALLIAPLIYGAITFVFTGLVVWLYNVVAKRVGGLEYSIEEISGSAIKT